MASTMPMLLAAACAAANLNCATGDLPRGKAAPRRADTETCGALGPGYTRAPGTDTCIKLGGSVRVEGAAILNR